MTSSLKNPSCVICKRGKKHNLGGGTETYILFRAEIRKNGLYQGAIWHVFCGSCIKPLLYDKNIDCANLVNSIIQIIIKGKGRNQTREIKVLY